MHSTSPNLLRYNVTQTQIGVLLSIWEPAPMNAQRLRPFLFMVKHRLPTEDDAQTILGQYLTAYQQFGRLEAVALPVHHS